GLEDLGHLGGLENLVEGDAFGGAGAAQGDGGFGGDGLGGVGGGVGRDDVAVFVEHVGGDGVFVEAVGGGEGGAGLFVGEEVVGLEVALADAREIAGEREGRGVVAVEVVGEVGSVAGDAGAEAVEGGEVFDDLVDLRGGEDVTVFEAGEDDVFGTEFEQD